MTEPWYLSPDVAALAADLPTPTYIYHGPTIDRAAAALRALRHVDRLFYAQKANDHPAVVKRITSVGFGVECTSAAEVAHAVDLAPAAPLLLTANFAPKGEYAAALAAGAAVTLDGLHPLLEWPELFRDREVILRFDGGEGQGHHRHVRTAGDDAKFGLLPSDLPAVREAASRAGARVVGLHTHSGSGIFKPGAWAKHLAFLAALAEHFPEVRLFDVGGGLGVRYGAGKPLNLGAVDRALGAARAAIPRKHELWLEAGRFLVCDAGILLTRVTQLKTKGDRRYVGVDAGMHALIRPALYGARHGVVCLSRPTAPPTQRVSVVGPICESADVLAWDAPLPDVREGDLLAITHAGAYGRTMASHYNRRRVGEVFLSG